MSSVYATEPASSGRVLFETTHGPLEFQLWCRECPLITKLFLQLCIDGFYDNMIFHRIVSDFLIQTGALRQGKKPVGFTKEYQKKVQASLALERRKYETHSRLRFNHRGQIAMALGVNDADDDELQPQFFITLDEAPYLDGKHVLFGTCSGPTIFNALRIGNLAVDNNHLPKDLDHAPRITACKIIENPIHVSVAPLDSVPWRLEENIPAEKKKKKRQGKKDLKLLSFGDEIEVEEACGIKSSHDVILSKTLGKSVDEKVIALVANGNTALRVIKKDETQNDPTLHSPLQDPVEAETDCAGRPSTSQAVGMPLDELLPSQRPSDTKHKKKPGLVEARLARFKGRAATNKRRREDETMAKLVAFQRKVKTETAQRKGRDQHGTLEDNSLAARMARKAETNTGHECKEDGEAYHGQVMDDDDKVETDDWLGTRFKCRRHLDLDSRLGSDEKGGDGRHMKDYHVIDEKQIRSDRGANKHTRRVGHRHHRK